MSKNQLSEERVLLIAQKIKKRFPETFRDIEKRAKEKGSRSKTSEVELKKRQDWVEKIEKVRSTKRRIDEKAEKYEKLRIEFLEKIQELKEALCELKKNLSENDRSS